MNISKGISYFFSIVGHPLMVVMYMLFLYLKVDKYLFPYSSDRDITTLVLIIFFTSVLIPVIAILLMMGVGFIKSLEMKDKQERIGPLIVVAISYLWLFLNIRTHNMIPIPFARFVLGALTAIFIAFFINNFSKISLHGVGIGGLLTGTFYLTLNHGKGYVVGMIGENALQLHNIMILVILLLFSGAVLTSRLHLKAHRMQDLIGGVLVGVFGQIVAFILF